MIQRSLPVDRDAAVELGQPPLRSWELTSNSSRYDRLVAAPSDETLELIWLLWTVIFFFIAAFIWVVFLGILSRRKTRSLTFNLYAVYMIFPDIVFTTSCVLTCLLNAASGHYYSATMCRFQAWYVVFGVAGSAWMNALIAWEVFVMLQTSHKGERYRPPSLRQVTLRSLAVYAYAGIIGAFGAFDLPSDIPYHTRVQNGAVCAPMEYNTASTIFFFTLAVPLMVAIPLAFILVLTYRILKSGYLPPHGKGRMIAVYFFRIDVVFLVMWAPALFFFYVYITSEAWVLFAASVWGHGQGFMSALLCLYKDDIRCAVWAFIKCQRGDNVLDDGENDTTPTRRSRLEASKSQVFISGLSSTPSSSYLAMGLITLANSNEDLSSPQELGQAGISTTRPLDEVQDEIDEECKSNKSLIHVQPLPTEISSSTRPPAMEESYHPNDATIKPGSPAFPTQ